MYNNTPIYIFMHLYINVYVPFIMLWRQKASSARSQEGPRNKAAAIRGTRLFIRVQDGNSSTRDVAGRGSKQSCCHQDLAPSCSEGFTKDNAVKKVFSSPPQEGLSQEQTPVNGLELCTLPNPLNPSHTRHLQPHICKDKPTL